MTEKRYEKTFLSYSRLIAQFEILFEKDRDVRSRYLKKEIWVYYCLRSQNDIDKGKYWYRTTYFEYLASFFDQQEE